MTIYHWILTAAFVYLFLAFMYFFIQAISLKGMDDPSISKGNEKAAVIYSMTTAMSPKKKESAFLHLPTYAAGMFFHLGTFFSLMMLVLIFSGWIPGAFIIAVFSGFILITSLCGIGIFIKRMTKSELRNMSNLDDYVSNMLVTLFQTMIALALLGLISLKVPFIGATLLFLYMPVGKLKHAVYFFSARLYLGRYYGKRGVWPVK